MPSDDNPLNYDVVGGTNIAMEPTLTTAEAEPKATELKRQDYLLGIALLLLVVFLWTSSNFITQDLFEEGYDKPFLVTYLNTSAFVLYLIPSLYRLYASPRDRPGSSGYEVLATDASQREPGNAPGSTPSHNEHKTDDHSPLTVQETIRLAAAFCLLWFAANWALNVGLQYTSVASATILSSMSGFFTLGIGRLFRIEKLTIAKISAVVLSFIGVTLVSLSDSSATTSPDLARRTLSTTASLVNAPLAPRPILGDALALFSALLYAVYVIVLKVRIKNESRIDMQLFFGFVGLFNILGFWPIAVLLHFVGLEPFELPHGRTVIIGILLNMFITWSSDYIYVLAMLKTTPLVVTVGLSLTIPLAVIGDFFLKKPSHLQVIAGAILVVVGFIVIGVEGPENAGSEEESQADVLTKRQFVADGRTELVQPGVATELSANEILGEINDSSATIPLKKKKKERLKHDAFLQRLESSQTPYSKSHNRRIKRKAKEQVAGGLSSMQAALALVEQPEDTSQANGPSQPTPRPGQIGQGKPAPKSKSQRKRALEVEKLRQPLIRSTPEFVANPFQTIRIHASNSLLKHPSTTAA
ncbi:hypothetical protein ONZ45_g1870 [Pleurotus djamor]|nr:hypothetical protein ONZ45_g1870 [Pleurotus djamor]